MPPNDNDFSPRNVLKALTPVWKWKTLGINLGIPLEKLDEIEQERFDVDDRKQGLVVLMFDDYKFGWEDICVALEGMNKSVLAEKIREEYCTPTFPPLYYTDVDDRKQGLVVLMFDDYKFGWEDICVALEKMNKSVLAKQIREEHCTPTFPRARLERVSRKTWGVTLSVIILTACILTIHYSYCQRGCSIPALDSQETLNHIFSHGDLKSVTFMVDALRIDPRMCINKWGVTTLMAAVRGNNIDVVKYLVEGWKWDIVCQDNWSVLHEACFLGHMSLIQYFMDKNSKPCGESLVNAAAKGGQVEVLKYLREKGHSIKCTGIWRGLWSPIHEASYLGQLNVVKYYAELVSDDICKECVDKDGNSLLHAVAVKRTQLIEGQLAVMKYLVNEKHCNILVQDLEGRTALLVAHKTHNQPIINYLASL